MILLIDTKPSEPKDLLELKAKKTVDKAATPQTQTGNANAAGGSRDAATSRQAIGGAAEAAGVLTAVDEDEEGGEEAEIPREFDYYSDDEAE